MMTYVLTERLWYTADKSRAVKEGDSAAAFLLGGPGQVIDMAEAERLGLVDAPEKGKKPAPNKKKEAPANKGVKFPPENKRQ